MFPQVSERLRPTYHRVDSVDRGNIAIQVKAIAFSPDRTEVTPQLRHPVTSAQDRLANLYEQYSKSALRYQGEGRQDRARLDRFIANVIDGAIAHALPMTAVELGYAELGARTRIDDVESGPKALKHAIHNVLHMEGNRREALLEAHERSDAPSNHAWSTFTQRDGLRHYRKTISEIQEKQYFPHEPFDTLLPRSALRTRIAALQLGMREPNARSATIAPSSVEQMTRDADVVSAARQWNIGELVAQAQGTEGDRLFDYIAAHHAEAGHAAQEGDAARSDVHRAIAHVLEGAVNGRFIEENQPFPRDAETYRLRWHLALLERAIVKVFREHPQAMHIGDRPGCDHIHAWNAFVDAGGENAYRALAHEHLKQVKARQRLSASIAAPAGGILCAAPLVVACCMIHPLVAAISIEGPIAGGVWAGINAYEPIEEATARYTKFSLVDTRPNIEAVIHDRRAGIELAQLSS